MAFNKTTKTPDGPLRKKRGQGVVHVSNLFAKYTNVLRAPQGSVVSAFIETVAEGFGFTIRKDQCIYNTNTQTLTVRVSGMLKSEIVLKKKVILAAMRERLGPKSAPKDIL